MFSSQTELDLLFTHSRGATACIRWQVFDRFDLIGSTKGGSRYLGYFWQRGHQTVVRWPSWAVARGVVQVVQGSLARP